MPDMSKSQPSEQAGGALPKRKTEGVGVRGGVSGFVGDDDDDDANGGYGGYGIPHGYSGYSGSGGYGSGSGRKS